MPHSFWAEAISTIVYTMNKLPTITIHDVTKEKPKRISPNKGNIMVTMRTREGLCIQKKGLDYQGLKTLVEKLEGLC